MGWTKTEERKFKIAEATLDKLISRKYRFCAGVVGRTTLTNLCICIYK